MSNFEVDFLEDTSILKTLPKEGEIKGTSIEGWFYKKFKISKSLIQIFLILIAIILIVVSIRFFLLAYMSNSEEDIRRDFEERVINTQLN